MCNAWLLQVFFLLCFVGPLFLSPLCDKDLWFEYWCASKHDWVWQRSSVEERFDLVIPSIPRWTVCAEPRATGYKSGSKTKCQSKMKCEQTTDWQWWRRIRVLKSINGFCGSSRDKISSLWQSGFHPFCVPQPQYPQFHALDVGQSLGTCPVWKWWKCLILAHSPPNPHGLSMSIIYLPSNWFWGIRIPYFVAMAISHCWSNPLLSHYLPLKWTKPSHIFEVSHQFAKLLRLNTAVCGGCAFLVALGIFLLLGFGNSWWQPAYDMPVGMSPMTAVWRQIQHGIIIWGSRCVCIVWAWT